MTAACCDYSNWQRILIRTERCTPVAIALKWQQMCAEFGQICMNIMRCICRFIERLKRRKMQSIQRTVGIGNSLGIRKVVWTCCGERGTIDLTKHYTLVVVEGINQGYQGTDGRMAVRVFEKFDHRMCRYGINCLHHLPYSVFFSACLPTFSLACLSFYSYSQASTPFVCTSSGTACSFSIATSEIWNAVPTALYVAVVTYSIVSQHRLFPSGLPTDLLPFLLHLKFGFC